MNMHGIITPAPDREMLRRRRRPVARALAWARQKRMFLLLVVLPSLLVAGYYYLIASDQYESEAHFMVRAAESTPVAGTGLGQVLSAAAGPSQSQTEAMSVADYMTSHDIVQSLQEKLDLVGRFRRPEADFFSRLHGDPVTPEKLLKFYSKQVKVRYRSDDGITTLEVRSFRPQDSYDIARTLLALGEQRVNALNVRSYNDALALARRQLREAEEGVARSQVALTRFRQSRGDIDPQGSGQAQIGLVSTLTQNLSAARAQLSAMTGVIRPDSPQYIATSRRVRALEAQVAAQSGRLAGGGTAIAADLGDYEDLRIRQEFAAKRYETAAASFEKAREQAQKQQLYVVRIVDANMPVKSLYPERGRIVLTVILGLLLVYAIGWLIIAGVREHAA
ncbi:lipopolysaccharide biosynthesis protein [Sphingomonas profundi]|uniref:lipopolysaccharide biosynthesis protein n=1 Tax=Alterirhizorhabdus profundi TaxID=2681549 RepID=UPI0012E8B439|nr:lipopolysaccharide biosynthesis protein [Sphingomonas profundi]